MLSRGHEIRQQRRDPFARGRKAPISGDENCLYEIWMVRCEIERDVGAERDADDVGTAVVRVVAD